MEKRLNAWIRKEKKGDCMAGKTPF